MDTDAKTVVISDEELGEIKHTQKNRSAQRKPEVEMLEDEEYETDYDDGDDEENMSADGQQIGERKKKKRKTTSRISNNFRISGRSGGSCRRRYFLYCEKYGRF